MVIMKNAIFVKISLIGLVIIPNSAFAQKLSFQGAYEYSMTDGRSQTLELCDAGRRWNNAGISNWSMEIMEVKKRDMYNRVKGRGMNMSDVNAYYSGVAAAMKKLCPDVW
jgi:hypothetical protein